MFEYFRGWKRKAGLVTLVVACALIAGMVRSHRVQDEVIFEATKYHREEYALISYGAAVHFLERHPEFHDQPRTKPPRMHWRSVPIRTDNFFSSPHLRWKWQFLGLGVREYAPQRRRGDLMIDWVVPYWLVALPLTLASAWLLLTKPRQKLDHCRLPTGHSCVPMPSLSSSSSQPNTRRLLGLSADGE